MPVDFPELAADPDFVSLMESLSVPLRYTGNATRSGQRRAAELGAIAITSNPDELVRTLAKLASGMILPGWRSG